MENREAIKKIIDFVEEDFTKDISVDSVKGFFGEMSDEKYYSILLGLEEDGYIKTVNTKFRGETVIFSLKITPKALSLFPNKEKEKIKKSILKRIYELSGEIIDKNIDVSAFENDFLELSADILNKYLLELESEGYIKTINIFHQGIPVVYDVRITIYGKSFLYE